MEPRSPTLQVDSLPAEPPGKPKNTGVGSLSLLQGIFPTQESNPGLLHCRRILYQLSYEGSKSLLFRLCVLWGPQTSHLGNKKSFTRSENNSFALTLQNGMRVGTQDPQTPPKQPASSRVCPWALLPSSCPPWGLVPTPITGRLWPWSSALHRPACWAPRVRAGLRAGHHLDWLLGASAWSGFVTVPWGLEQDLARDRRAVLAAGTICDQKSKPSAHRGFLPTGLCVSEYREAYGLAQGFRAQGSPAARAGEGFPCWV